jgi:hypothetical protein
MGTRLSPSSQRAGPRARIAVFALASLGACQSTLPTSQPGPAPGFSPTGTAGLDASGPERRAADWNAAPFLAMPANAPSERGETAGFPVARSWSGLQGSGQPNAKTAWGDTKTIDVFFVPAFFMTVDTDQAGGGALQPDIDPGLGIGLRGAMGNGRESIGIMYMGLFSDEERTNTDVKLHSLMADFESKLPLGEGGGRLALRAGGSLGFDWVEFSGNFDDEIGGIMMLRMTLDFQATDKLNFYGGLAGFFSGSPGDTTAYGSVFLLGGYLNF